VSKHDLTGRTIGKLTVKGVYRKLRIGGEERLTTLWECDCLCGRKGYLVREKNLLHPTKPTGSCGCIKAAMIAEKIKTQGRIRGRYAAVKDGVE